MTIKRALSELKDILKYTHVKGRLTAINRDAKDFGFEIEKTPKRPYKLKYKQETLFVFNNIEDLKNKVDRALGFTSEKEEIPEKEIIRHSLF